MGSARHRSESPRQRDRRSPDRRKRDRSPTHRRARERSVSPPDRKRVREDRHKRAEDSDRRRAPASPDSRHEGREDRGADERQDSARPSNGDRRQHHKDGDHAAEERSQRSKQSADQVEAGAKSDAAVPAAAVEPSDAAVTDAAENGRTQETAAPATAVDGSAAADAMEGAAAAAPAAAPTRKQILNRTGGVYIPPFKLARMMQEVNDRSSPEYQRMTWDALRKSINGLVNKVNVTNIKMILPEFFQENLVRGRGLFCRSIMKSQMASPTFTPVYAALLAVINTKFPEIGELLLHRVILQFRRAYKRNDKPVCMAVTKFIAHLISQGVAHEVLALEVLILLLEKPSDDSVEVAADFSKEVGAYLQDTAPQGLHTVFERFRTILHEGEIDKRVQFMIEGLFAIRKAGFAASGFPSIKPELDLVEAEDQITHELGLEDEVDAQLALDVFKFDPEFEQHEKEYAAISREILGEEEEGDEGAGSEGGEGEEGGEESEEEEAGQQQGGMDITDATETNIVNLRRTIYLTIMSSLDFEEAGHKLLKMGVPQGKEIELVTMLIECCSVERTYLRYYGLLSQRFCYLNMTYRLLYEDCFRKQYAIIHRLETNKLRNVAKLFAHLMATDAISWGVLTCVRLTEQDTTSSSRIFIKHLFQELSETLGMIKLNARLNDPSCQQFFDGIFPKETPVDMRFSINFFTSIGLGGITEKMREYYKNLPKMIMAQQAKQQSSSSDSSSSDSSSSDSSSSDSSSSDSSDSD